MFFMHLRAVTDAGDMNLYGKSIREHVAERHFKKQAPAHAYQQKLQSPRNSAIATLVGTEITVIKTSIIAFKLIVFVVRA